MPVPASTWVNVKCPQCPFSCCHSIYSISNTIKDPPFTYITDMLKSIFGQIHSNTIFLLAAIGKTTHTCSKNMFRFNPLITRTWGSACHGIFFVFYGIKPVVSYSPKVPWWLPLYIPGEPDPVTSSLPTGHVYLNLISSQSIHRLNSDSLFF